MNNEINEKDYMTLDGIVAVQDGKYICKPENWTGEKSVIKCPCCGHMIILGLPHPDFNSPDMLVSEDELTKLSKASSNDAGQDMGGL